MTSTDALIRDLSVALAPVRRRSLRREAAALLALGMGELALLLMAGVMRPDMAQVILSPFMMWKVGSLVVLAGASCLVAMRSFAPPLALRRGLALTLEGLLALAALALVSGIFVATAADRARPWLERLHPVEGMLCSVAIVVLSLPMMALLGRLMRRAAPPRPQRSALAAGFAAATSGALIFTICCPMNDPLYVIVWYSLGVAVVTAVSRWLLPRRFRL